MTILVLGGNEDEHATAVLTRLRSGGHDAELLDSRWFPTQMTIEFDPQTEGGFFNLPSGRRLALTAVQAVYWRNYFGVGAPALPDEEQAYIGFNDARSLFESILLRLPARWVNPWEAFQLHQTKPAALATVARLGVVVPPTLLTNDPLAVRSFARRHGSCIFKPVQGGAHTRRLTDAHLTDEHLQHLALAPITVQEEVAGVDIRVFVAGAKVLACEIRADTLDFRDAVAPEIAPHKLPRAVESQCLRIAHALHLRWTGMDFRRTPQGAYVFLEANPSPMFLGFQQATGLPLLESLIAVLTTA